MARKSLKVPKKHKTPINWSFQYPTIKLFRHGKVLKKEYRGTRSVDAIKAFLLEQIRDPVQKVTSLEQLNDLTHADRRTKSQVKSDFWPIFRHFLLVFIIFGQFCVIFGQFSIIFD